METFEQEPSFRLELMRIREKVSGIRKMYLILAMITALVTPLALFAGDEPSWVVGLCLATLSGTLFLARRRCLDQLRFWTLVPAITWTVMVVAAMAARYGTGEFNLLNGRGVWDLTFQLAIIAAFWGSIPSREEEALAREHREEWDAYNAGTTPAFRRRRAKNAKPESAEGATSV